MIQSINPTISKYYLNTPNPAEVSKIPAENKKNNKPLIYGLIGLGVLGVAIILINNARKGKIKNIETPIPEPVLNIPYSQRIKNYLDNLPEHLKHALKSSAKSFKDHELFKSVKNKSDFEDFEKLSIIKKHDSKAEYPDFLAMTGIDDSKADDLCKLFAGRFGFDYDYRIYSGKNPDKFVSMLENYSSSKNHVFLNVGNFDNLAQDLSKTENSSLLDKLKNSATSRKVTYFVNSDVKADYAIKLDFEKSINSAIKNTDLWEYNQKFSENFSAPLKQAQKNIKSFVYNDDFFDDLRKQLHNGEFTYKPLMLVENSNAQNVEKLAKEIDKLTSAEFKIINNDTDFIKNITGKLEEQKELFSSSNKRLFLYLEKPQESKELASLIENAESKYHTTIILDKNFENIVEKIPKYEVSMYSENWQPKFNEIYSKMQQKMKRQNFLHIKANDLDPLDKLFFLRLAEVQAKPNEKGLINNLILQGDAEHTKITANEIKNCLEDVVNYKTFTFDKSKPQESLNELFNLATQKDSGKPWSLIEINKLDDLLTDYNDAPSRRFIGKFNEFSERVADDCKTCFILRTAQDLENFDSASIAPHRFGLKLTVI